MEIAAILLGIAALGGLTMAVMRLRGTPRPPGWMAMGHGVVAAAGLVLLINAAATAGIPRMAQIALGIFMVAAMGGAYINLRFHQKKLPLPLPIIGGHAALAVTGFVLLLASVLEAH